VIDLHVHSSCSDGSETPERIVELAAAAGCSAVALTDHDGLDGVARAKERALSLDLSFVPGCEVSCAFSPGAMHVLSYFVEAGEGPLQDELGRLREDRARRNERLVERLQALGLPVSFDEVRAAAGSSVIGRPHFASVLVANGAATDIQDAFERWLTKGAPGYVPKARVEAASFLAAAKGSRAICALAHPLSLGLEPAELDRVLGELAQAGLVAVECYYGRYSPAERARLVDLAHRHGLVARVAQIFTALSSPTFSSGPGRAISRCLTRRSSS